MKYILILFLFGYQSGGATSAEFNSLKACQVALNTVISYSENKPYYKPRHITAVCVPKGAEVEK